MYGMLSLKQGPLIVGHFAELQGVPQEHRDRHRTDPPGDGGDQTRLLVRFLEVHVAGERAGPARIRVDADVDHHRSRLDPRPGHVVGPADGGAHNIGVANDAGEVLGLAVAHGHGGVRVVELYGGQLW